MTVRLYISGVENNETVDLLNCLIRLSQKQQSIEVIEPIFATENKKLLKRLKRTIKTLPAIKLKGEWIEGFENVTKSLKGLFIERDDPQNPHADPIGNHVRSRPPMSEYERKMSAANDEEEKARQQNGFKDSEFNDDSKRDDMELMGNRGQDIIEDFAPGTNTNSFSATSNRQRDNSQEMSTTEMDGRAALALQAENENLRLDSYGSHHEKELNNQDMQFLRDNSASRDMPVDPRDRLSDLSDPREQQYMMDESGDDSDFGDDFNPDSLL